MRNNKLFFSIFSLIAISLASCQEGTNKTYVKPFESSKHSLIYKDGTLVGISFTSPDAPEIDPPVGKEMGTGILEYFRNWEEIEIHTISNKMYYYVNGAWDKATLIKELNDDTGYTHCVYVAMAKYFVDRYTYTDGDNVIISHSKFDRSTGKLERHYWTFNKKDDSWSENEETYNKIYEKNRGRALEYFTDYNYLRDSLRGDAHYYSSGENHLRIDSMRTDSELGIWTFNSVEYENNRPWYYYYKTNQYEMITELISFFDYQVRETRPNLYGYNNEITNPTIDIEDCFYY